MLTQERLKELLRYEPEMGKFYWLVRRQGTNGIGSEAGGFGNGRVHICVDGKLYLSHRLAWLYVNGCFPEKHIDHINGDPTDNRICNLREATQAENLQNRCVASRQNKSSGLLGVTKRKNRGRKPFEARIKLDRKTHHLGNFCTAEEAHSAYLEAKKTMHPFGR